VRARGAGRQVLQANRAHIVHLVRIPPNIKKPLFPHISSAPAPEFAPLPRFCDQSACDASAVANTPRLFNPTSPAFKALTKCVRFHCCQYRGSCITAAAWASVDGCEKMTCRWLQSVGTPCCLGLAACPVKIHATATRLKSPAPNPSDRVPIPLIIVLTPWLALSRQARPKVLRAALQRFPVAVFVLVARVSHAQTASSIAVPIRTARLNRWKLDVGLRQLAGLVRNSTLSSRQQANRFYDVPHLNSDAAILSVTTYNSRNPPNCDIIKERPSHRMLCGG